MTYRNIVLGLVLLCGCGDDKAEERTRSEFCADWASAACSEETLSACQSANKEDCEKSQADACLDVVPEEFSDAKGQPCIDAVRDAYKDGDLRGDELATVFRLAGPCALIIKGPGGKGAACSTTEDCDAPSGFECVRKGSAERGECQQPATVEPGRDCSAAEKVCTSGFYCKEDFCVEAKKAGADCAIQEECGPGLFCNSSDKCEAGRNVSADCEADRECATGICLADGDEQICVDRVVLARSEPICEDLR